MDQFLSGCLVGRIAGRHFINLFANIRFGVRSRGVLRDDGTSSRRYDVLINLRSMTNVRNVTVWASKASLGK